MACWLEYGGHFHTPLCLLPNHPNSSSKVQTLCTDPHCCQSKFYMLIKVWSHTTWTRDTFASENRFRTRALLCLPLGLGRVASGSTDPVASCHTPRLQALGASPHSNAAAPDSEFHPSGFCHRRKDTCLITSLLLSTYSHKEPLSHSFQWFPSPMR